MDHREAERKPPMLSFSRNHRVCICEYHDPVRTFDKRLPLSLSLFLSLDPPRVTPRTRTRVCIYIYIYTRGSLHRGWCNHLLIAPAAESMTSPRIGKLSGAMWVRRGTKQRGLLFRHFFSSFFFYFNNTNTKVIGLKRIVWILFLKFIRRCLFRGRNFATNYIRKFHRAVNLSFLFFEYSFISSSSWAFSYLTYGVSLRAKDIYIYTHID